MKKRTIAGGVVVGVVLFSMFGGMGLLPGSGSNGDGNSDNDNAEGGDSNSVQVSADGSNRPQEGGQPGASDQAKNEKPGGAEKPKKPRAVPVTTKAELFILASGIGIGYTDGKYRSGTMEEAIEIAKKATGDEDGIKVRIMRDKSARLATWSRLEEELHKAGIKSDEIQTPRQLLDMSKKKAEAGKKKADS